MANRLVHESASSLHLLARALRPVLDHTPDPFLMNLKGPMKKGIGGWNAAFFFSIQTIAKMKSGKRFPTLWAFLEDGKAQTLHERYLCRHRARWYAQEDRPPPPIVCTCMGRVDARSGRPFRFILNNSKATVANVYLTMYPKPVLSQALSRDPELIRQVWKILNGIMLDQLLGEGRVYGGGLHKPEPKELANVPVPEIAELLPREHRPTSQKES